MGEDSFRGVKELVQIGKGGMQAQVCVITFDNVVEGAETQDLVLYWIWNWATGVA